VINDGSDVAILPLVQLALVKACTVTLSFAVEDKAGELFATYVALGLTEQ